MCEVYLCAPPSISVYLCACMEAGGVLSVLFYAFIHLLLLKPSPHEVWAKMTTIESQKSSCLCLPRHTCSNIYNFMWVLNSKFLWQNQTPASVTEPEPKPRKGWKWQQCLSFCSEGVCVIFLLPTVPYETSSLLGPISSSILRNNPLKLPVMGKQGNVI